MDEQIPEKEEDQSMKDFSSTIATCQSKIKSIDAQIDNLMRLKAEVISSTGQEERQISNKINMIVNSVQTTQNEMDNKMHKYSRIKTYFVIETC